MAEHSFFAGRASLTLVSSVALLGGALLGGGCSVISDFGHYTPRGGADGSIDSGRSDGGGVDGGGIDGGGVDGGSDDGGGDAGPTDCEPACAAGETCEAGVCMCGTGSACSGAQGCCDGTCTALDSVDHCGACGTSCGTRPGASASCSGSGTCAYACNGGVDDCNGDIASPSGDGCEANLSDTSTCRSCTVSCGAGEVCSTSGCMSTCPGSETMCGTSCYTAGSTCRCTAASAPGGLACTSGAVMCSYPTEVCNGADDDCNGVSDETFACVRGVVSTCTVTVGTCTASGTRTCSTSCTSGACVTAETCSRSDTDCDGWVDEGMLVQSASTTSIAGVAVKPRATFNPTTGEIGVVYGLRIGANMRLEFRRMAADGSSVGMVVLISGNAADWDVAYDGNHYSVAFLQPGDIEVNLIRLDAATGAIGGGVGWPAMNLPAEIRLDRIGTADQVAVVWTEADSAGGRQRAAYAVVDTRAAVATASLVGQTEMESSGGARLMDSPAAVRTLGGCVVAYSHHRNDGTMGDLELRNVLLGGGTGAMRTLLSDPDYERAIEMAFDPITMRVGVTYSKQDPATGTLRFAGFIAVDAGLSGPSPEITLGASIFQQSIATGADGNFAILTQDSGGSLRLVRRRASDLATLPDAALLMMLGEHIQGVGGTASTRYVTFGSSASPGGLAGQRVLCSP